MDWKGAYAREERRYRDGLARKGPGQLMRVGSAAYGAGLALLMVGQDAEARRFFARAAASWRESFETAAPDSWGRPIGAIKAAILAGEPEEAAAYGAWTLELGAASSGSPVGRYAAVLALLALERDAEAGALAASLQASDAFPPEAAAALAALAAGPEAPFARALAALLGSFEVRDAFLEDLPVADTVLVLQALGARRGLRPSLARSPLLPGGG